MSFFCIQFIASWKKILFCNIIERITELNFYMFIILKSKVRNDFGTNKDHFRRQNIFLDEKKNYMLL